MSSDPTKTGVKYIGNDAPFVDNLYGSGLKFMPNQTRLVEHDLAAKLIRHAEFVKDVGFDYVTATTNLTGESEISFGGIKFSSAQISQRRPMYPRGIVEYGATPADITTLGTVSTVGGDTRTVNNLATSAGSTARIFRSFAVTGLATDRYYQVAATVDAFVSAGGITKGWLGTSGGIAESSLGGTIFELPNTTTPVVGQRMGFNFRPSASTVTLRGGLGINFTETVAINDRLQLSGFTLVEVDSINAPIQPFYETKYGYVGRADQGSGPWSMGSCVMFSGDSWFNDPTDPPGLVGRLYGREAIVVATAGYTLSQIATDLDAAFASTAYLNAPNRFPPTIAVSEGGINDVNVDVSSKALFTKQQTILAKYRARNIYPIVVIPVLATDSTYYTAGRAQVLTDYQAALDRAGIDYIRAADFLLNVDGTANVTYMSSESSIWIHPTAAGYLLVAKAIEAKLREIERNQRTPQSGKWAL